MLIIEKILDRDKQVYEIFFLKSIKRPPFFIEIEMYNNLSSIRIFKNRIERLSSPYIKEGKYYEKELLIEELFNKKNSLYFLLLCDKKATYFPEIYFLSENEYYLKFNILENIYYDFYSIVYDLSEFVHNNIFNKFNYNSHVNN